MQNKLIYLDMDGVCANFVRGVGILYKRPALDLEYRTLSKRLGYEEPPWNFFPMITKDEATAWKRIAEEGWEFWRNLEETDEYTELLEMLRGYEIVFVSHPTRSADSIKGKLLWLQDRFTDVFSNYFLGGWNKASLAGSGGILIDDNQDNVDKYIAAGGMAILFPRPWNRNRDRNWKEYVEEGLYRITTVRGSSSSLPIAPDMPQEERAYVANLVQKEIALGLPGPPTETTSSILDEAKEKVFGDRGRDYGHPREDFQCSADIISAFLRRKYGIPLELSADDIPPMMISLKLSRLAHQTKRDSIVDIAGYAETWGMLENVESEDENVE